MKKINIKNKKAYHDYSILEELQAGIVLNGNEIKSIRTGKVNLKGSFCKFFKNELNILEMHISKYESSNTFNLIDETRVRKLLIKKREAIKWQKKVDREGLTIIPLKLYINDRNMCKVLIGLCQGKKNHDKRASEKEKTLNRETRDYL